MKGHGFTLIELLGVITVIAILAAILFPVYVAARARAHQAMCLSNVRELGRALLLYADDYDNHGVPAWGWGWDAWGDNSAFINGPLFKYVRGGLSSANITRCPDAIASNGRLPSWSLTINGWLFSYRFDGGGWEGVDYTVYPRPSSLGAIVCENTNPRLGMWVNDTIFTGSDLTSNVHNGKSVLCCLDGHARPVAGLVSWFDAKWPDGEFVFHHGAWH